MTTDLGKKIQICVCVSDFPTLSMFWPDPKHFIVLKEKTREKKKEKKKINKCIYSGERLLSSLATSMDRVSFGGTKQ